MDLNTVTVQDFKDQFPRDFPYLPNWDSEDFYNIGQVVYYGITRLFYICKINGTTQLPTDTDHWDLYTQNVNNYVLDSDITRAFQEAQINLNQALFGDDPTIKLAYLYMTAHYLVMDLRAAKAGVSGRGEQIVSGRTVGSVSENYNIPTALSDSTIRQFFAKTYYGQKFYSMAEANMVGNIGIVWGGATPW